MDSALARLRGRAKDHPEDDALLKLISKLEEPNTTWEEVQEDFTRLTSRGLWDADQDDARMLEKVRVAFAARERSHIQPPPGVAIALPSPPQQVKFLTEDPIPAEVLATMNDVHFLHVLATEPSAVLPPGKSILSVLLQGQSSKQAPSDKGPSLHSRVEQIVHRVFWDEALEGLSDPLPGKQLARLHLIYKDLHEAAAPLLPSSHPTLSTLLLPPSPSSAPLTSASLHLSALLSALRTRCAPARDTEIDDAMAHLHEPASAQLIIAGAHAILDICEHMRADLAQFKLGTLSEADLRRALAVQARARERAFVLAHWPPSAVAEAWRTWTAGGKWSERLLTALRAPYVVTCPLPGAAGAHTNALPPALLFVLPTLVHVQNTLQALVIAASLRALAPADAPGDFTARIWALLAAELDPRASEGGGGGDTKLVNLADEVVRAHGGAGLADEARLRAAVARTLRTDDAAFALLQARLFSALASALGTVRVHEATPARMQTGVAERSRLDVDGRREEEVRVGAKGFEDPVLGREAGKVLVRLREIVEWTRGVWPDLAHLEGKDI